MPHRASCATLSLVVIVLAAAPSVAQSQRAIYTGSALWISGSIGYFDPNAVNDGTTQTSWDFGSGIQYRGSLEWSLDRGSTIGVEASFSRMPLVYWGAAECDGCNAHADIIGAMAKYHVGGGGTVSFFQTFDLSAGVVEFTNFRTDAGKVTLAPKNDPDFAFAFGYGFGYALSQDTQLFMGAEYSSTLHQRKGLPSNVSAMNQAYTVRAGMRFGIGQRSAVR